MKIISVYLLHDSKIVFNSHKFTWTHTHALTWSYNQSVTNKRCLGHFKWRHMLYASDFEKFFKTKAIHISSQEVNEKGYTGYIIFYSLTFTTLF